MSGAPRFPVALRKMWSGSEVQDWIDANVAVTLRDYLAAHAPAKPQEWFTPVMQESCPMVPSLTLRLSDEQRTAIERLEYMEGDYPLRFWAEEFIASRTLQEKAQAAWQAEFRKQLLVQWPYAWADEMLKVRG